MRIAAPFAGGRVVTGQSHLEAFEKLSDAEKDSPLTSGVFNDKTGEFPALTWIENTFSTKKYC